MIDAERFEPKRAAKEPGCLYFVVTIDGPVEAALQAREETGLFGTTIEDTLVRMVERGLEATSGAVRRGRP